MEHVLSAALITAARRNPTDTPNVELSRVLGALSPDGTVHDPVEKKKPTKSAYNPENDTSAILKNTVKCHLSSKSYT